MTGKSINRKLLPVLIGAGMLNNAWEKMPTESEKARKGNKKIRERMGRMGQEFVKKNFSLESMIEKTLFLYEEVISD